MTYTTEQIETSLYDGFGKAYKAFSSFVDNSEYWDYCLDAVRDKKFMNNIIFCNDKIELPPVGTLLKARPISGEPTKFEKCAIGAFWGYVFKFVFGYKGQESVSSRSKKIGTASRFIDSPDEIEVI